MLISKTFIIPPSINKLELPSKLKEINSPTMAETRANKIYGIRKRYVDLNLSSNVVDLFMNSWSKHMQKQYSLHNT